jgi:hypothetical protein
MTMFSRRSIDSLLKALASVLTGSQIEDLVKKLNLNKVDSVAAEWEISVLFGLIRLGRVHYEPTIAAKRSLTFYLYQMSILICSSLLMSP